MTPLEPWERVFVGDKFFEGAHGEMDCIDCHLGNPQIGLDKDAAHEDLMPYPSEDPEFFCASCHESEVENFEQSLHFAQEGYFERFSLRAGYSLRDSGHEHEFEEFTAECAACHATCGQCHISRPRSVGGGFNWEHEFKKKPDLKTNCTACHGSRIGEEYTGSREGFKADVHYVPGAKTCEFCHSGYEMHGGDGTHLTYRYDEDKTAGPQCELCHSAVEDQNIYHSQHWAGDSGVTLACQVCHSQSYKNCNGCHVGGEGITGSSYVTFEIGRNYLKDNLRYEDYDYIAVRHIPIAPNTYEEWGVDDLQNFETSEPTWKLTTPHNIQKWTPQTDVGEGQSCGAACHDSDYYLRSDDVEFYEDANYDEESGDVGYGYDDLERERQANSDVIIPE